MQYARPSSDIENPGGWTTEPLWDKIEEEPFDDVDYLISPKTATGDSFTIGLSGVTDPEIHTGHIIRIRAKTGVTGTFKYELMQGAVVIKDSGDVVLTTEFAEYNMTLSEAEAAEITDYTALRVRVTAITTKKNQRQNVSWIRVDVPDLAGEEHSGTGSISGNGSAAGTVKKGGLGSAIKSAGGTLLALGLAGMLGIASIAGGGSQLGVGEKSTAGTASISGSGSQVVVGKKIAAGGLSISGRGSIVATGVKAEGETHFGIASISGNGAFATGGIKQAAIDVTIGANGVLSGAGEKQSLADSLVTGGGSVIATGEKYEGEAHSGVASVSGNGGIDATVTKQALADLVISSNGIFGGNGIKQVPGSLAVTGNGVLGGVGIKQALGDSTIIGGGSIVAVGTMSESHSGVAIVSGSGIIEGAGLKQAPSDLVIIGGGSIVAVGYGQKAFIEVVKTVFLKSKLTERRVELKSTIKPSIVLNSEIKPEGEE